MNARGAARTGLGKPTALAVLATTATATAVTVGIAGTGSEDDAVTAEPSSFSGSAGARRLGSHRPQPPRRVTRRARLAYRPAGDSRAGGDGHQVRDRPPERLDRSRARSGKRVGLVPWGTKLAVTGQVVGHWSEVLLERDVGAGG